MVGDIYKQLGFNFSVAVFISHFVHPLQGGGMFIHVGSSATVSGTMFENCLAHWSGGGMFVDHASATVSGTVFSYCLAQKDKVTWLNPFVGLIHCSQHARCHHDANCVSSSQC